METVDHIFRKEVWDKIFAGPTYGVTCIAWWCFYYLSVINLLQVRFILIYHLSVCDVTHLSRGRLIGAGQVCYVRIFSLCLRTIKSLVQ